MEKDFDRWNEEKKKVHNESSRFYTVREIWWCRLGVNVGSEQDGGGLKFLRPIVIMQSFGIKTCLVVPLTTSSRTHPFRVPIGCVDGKEASAVISQMRIIDTKRLVEKVCFLEKTQFEKIRKTIKDVL